MESVAVDGQEVTVREDGKIFCTCRANSPCPHVVAVLSDDPLKIEAGSGTKALSFIGPTMRSALLLYVADGEKDPVQRARLERVIHHLDKQIDLGG